MEKFNIDKRKVSLSAHIRSGKMTKKEALEILMEKPYPDEKINEDKHYILEKLGLTKEEFDKIMSSPIQSFIDYPSYYKLIRKLRFFIKIACKLKLVPEILYEKYAK